MQRSSKFNFLTTITPDDRESDVEHKVVIPLLRLLGYADVDWRSQFRVGSFTLDFLIHPPESHLHVPYLIIEAKAPNKSIAQSGWQIRDYMRKTDAVLGLLTNGCQFQLFYGYRGKVVPIANYSHTELIAHFKPFYNLLAKVSCLKFSSAILKGQQQIGQRFLAIIAESFENKILMELAGESTIAITDERASRESERKRVKSMIVTVFNNKGGVGKTTLTVNLAATLAQRGKRVLLIDIDAQANLSTGLGIDPLTDVELAGKKDITHLLTEPRTKLDEVIHHKYWSNPDIQLDIVPSHIRLSRMENTLIQMVDSDRILAKKLRNHNYDYIFIDPPPSFGKVNRISLMASSGILIPTQLSPYPIRALEYVITQAHEVGDFKEEALPILGIAVSMYDQRSKQFNASMIEKLREMLGKTPGGEAVDLFPEDSWIPRLNVVSQCPERGYPLQEAEFDTTLLTQDREAAQRALEKYENLASHFIKRIESQHENF